ncbi:MAG: radical SAM family heme chaperone HemW [Methylococcaceae bacterium]|nr:radical SAM family heme chaperone HemW [Methylococcaceae bacterium]
MLQPSLSLYVHFPWCVRKCPYCDFNSHAVEGEVPERDYVDALLADLDHDAGRIGGRIVETVFMGGGTPSLFNPAAIARLLEGIAGRVALAPDAEVTLEANPGTVEAGRFEGYRAAGVNRLSIGVQSFDDGLLQALGRIHGGAEAIAAADAAHSAGFDNFNLDLMFGLPGQTLRQALADVATAVRLQPTHISYYQLTLEPNTLFHRYPPALPQEEATWEIQRSGQQLLERSGYRQYEVSAYARDGWRCRHNLNYWRFGDYLGIGAGAHGKLTDPVRGIVRYWRHKNPRSYLETAGTAEGMGGETTVAEADLPMEFLMNGLRLREGFSEKEFLARTGLDPAALEPGLSQCLEKGLLARAGGAIRCTDRGWNFLDNVLEHFVPTD